MKHRDNLRVVLLPWLVILVLVAGCDDSTYPQSCVMAGRLQGRVTTGGDPSISTIMAYRVIDGVETENYYPTHPDENGSYVLDLPAGNYIVRLRPMNHAKYTYDYTESGLGYGQIPPDTLSINDAVSPIEIDFLLGGLSLQVALSDVLDGESGAIKLHLKDEVETGVWRTYVDYGSATIESGRVDIEAVGLLPGEYRVEVVLGARQYMCYCPYDGEHFWMPGTRDEAASPWYSIVPDSLLALDCEIATESARIEGRITGAWQNLGLAVIPELAIVSPDSTIIMGRRRVFEDGRFGVDVYLPGPVKLLVYHGGVEQWIGGPRFEEATVYNLQPGQTISGIELNQCGLTIDARGDNGSVTDFEILFYDVPGMRLVSTAYSELGSGNLVGVTNLWPGDYLLYFKPSRYFLGSTSWRPQWFDRAAESTEAQLVTISSPGEIVRLDVTLERGGTISGQFSEPLPDGSGYHVIVTSANEFRWWGGRFALGGHSTFGINGLADGDYKIGIYPSGLGWDYGDPPPVQTQWYPGTTDWNSAEVIEIRNAKDVDGLVLSLP